MNKLWLYLSWALFCGTAIAGDLTLGNYERMVLNVPEGTTNDSTGSILIAPMAGSLEKTGKGTWTIPLAGIAGNDAPITIGVGEGTVRITDGSAPGEIVEPPACVQAAFWLKADVNLETVTQTNDTTGVSRWLDAREASLSGSSYPRATAVGCFTNNSKEVLHPLFPTVRTTSGHPAVYFGSRGTDKAAWMRLHNGQGRKTNISLYHLFLVHSVSNFWQAPFSVENDGNPFFVDNTGTPVDRSTGPRYLAVYTAQPPAYNMFAYRNGILLDPSIQQITTSLAGLQTLEYQLFGAPASVNAIFNDRNFSSCQGGDYICEALLFTNRLSSAERLQISDYLVRKYTQRTMATLSPVMAEDTAIEVRECIPSNVIFNGSCTLRKVGENDLWYSMLYGRTLRGVQVDRGSLSAETINLPYVFRPGEAISISTNKFRYHVTRSPDVSPTAAEVNAGGATVAVSGLKKEIKTLTMRNGTLVLSGSTSALNWKHVPAPVIDSAAINLSGTATAEREVVFPEDGTYELSFTIRKTSSGNEPHLCDIGIKTDGVLSNFTRVIAYEKTDLTRRFLCRDTKAGVHTLVFTGRNSPSSTLSDLRLDPVQPETETVFPVPNGDFERVALPAYANFATNNTAESWTFQQKADTGKSVGGVGIVYSGFKNSAFSGNLAAARYGEVQLVFYHTDATAVSGAFSVPAGTWQLRTKAMNWGTSTYNWEGLEPAQRCNNGGVLRAAVAINGGSPTTLGSWTASGRYWTSVTFDTPFTVADGDTVSIRLDQTKDHGSVLADEIELVRVKAVNGELVQNGSFIPSQGGWNLCPKITNKYGKTVSDYITLAPGWFGSWKCDDHFAMRVANQGFLTQAITFPEAGIYCLRFWVRGRYPDGGDTTPFVTHTLKAWLSQNGTTNTVVPFVPATTTNYVEKTVLFEIPSRANMTWDIGFAGLEGGDSALDCVSIKKASVDELPEISPDTSLILEGTSSAVLEFSGTLELAGVKIGGRSYHGVIDEERLPGALSGPGTLYVKPRGLVLMFR